MSLEEELAASGTLPNKAIGGSPHVPIGSRPGGASGSPPKGASSSLPKGAGSSPPNGASSSPPDGAGGDPSAGGKVPLMDFLKTDPGPEGPPPVWPIEEEEKLGISGAQSAHDPNGAIPDCPPDSTKPPQKPPAEDVIGASGIERIKTQDRYLQLISHKIAIWGPPEPTPEESGNWEFVVLQDTVDVVRHFCPESTVPKWFLDNIVQKFKLLYGYMNPGRGGHITTEEHDWIHKLLDHCVEAPKPSDEEFTTDKVCKDEILGDMARNPICELKEEASDAAHFDPMLDFVWRVYELVQTVCFVKFDGYSRVWHRYMIAIQDLFSLPIKQRWAYPQKDVKYFKRILGSNYETYARNLGKCIQFHAINTSPVGVRLHRPYEPYDIRYSKDVERPFEPRPTPRPRSAPVGLDPTLGRR